jgi:DNA polymerase III alpha subunit
MFVHLHTHSWFSLGEGASSPAALLGAAAAHGFRVLACTDTNAVYGAVEFQQSAEAAGIRPIHGAALEWGGEECVALAENEAGWAALCRTITAIHWTGRREDGRTGRSAQATSHRPVVPSSRLSDLIATDRTGVLLLSASVPFLERIVARSGPAGVYAELVPGKQRHAVLAAARRLGVPPVASNAVRFAHPEDWARHRLLVAIGRNGTLADGAHKAEACRSLRPPRPPCPPDAWLTPASDLARHFPDVPEALDRAGELAERCRYRIPLGERRAPARATAPSRRSPATGWSTSSPSSG